MSEINMRYIGSLIINLLIFVLITIIYLYINKLEQIGCDCSNNPDRTFIKTYSIVALVFLLFTAFVSIEVIGKMMGSVIAMLYSLLIVVFYMIFIYYIYTTFTYVRYLINEKCKCSEDISREIIMMGTFIELVLFFVTILTMIIIPVLTNSFSYVIANIGNVEKDIKGDIYNPVSSLSKSPRRLIKSTKDIGKFLKKSSKDLKKLSR